MRNWNANKCKTNGRRCGLAYLWGIETPSREISTRKITVFLAYLWGIETLRRKVFSFPAQFLAYLWGIETWCIMKVSHLPGRVFSLPMRNWNTLKSKKTRLVLCVFSLPMRNWNMRPAPQTVQGFLFLAYLWGIETLVWWILWGRSGNVFSLPMRNWNWHKKRPVRDRSAFLAYLWGIETNDVRPLVPMPLWFLAYLWGIETRFLPPWLRPLPRF